MLIICFLFLLQSKGNDGYYGFSSNGGRRHVTSRMKKDGGKQMDRNERNDRSYGNQNRHPVGKNAGPKNFNSSNDGGHGHKDNKIGKFAGGDGGDQQQANVHPFTPTSEYINHLYAHWGHSEVLFYYTLIYFKIIHMRVAIIQQHQEHRHGQCQCTRRMINRRTIITWMPIFTIIHTMLVISQHLVIQFNHM